MVKHIAQPNRRKHTPQLTRAERRDLNRRLRVNRAYDFATLKRVCEMDEREFAGFYDMESWDCDQAWPADQFFYKKNGSNILAVAHLDTVAEPEERACYTTMTAAGPIVFSGGLDDRQGAYTILELLPKLGLKYDILLTLGEEWGMSTAEFFHPEEHGYNWMIEFDRGGTDVVMYDYEDLATARLVRECGARVGNGSFSDIAYLEHLGVKGFNWGVGYQDYHGPRGHFWVNDYLHMVSLFLKFAAANSGTLLPHVKKPPLKYIYSGGKGGGRGGYSLGGGSRYGGGGSDYGLWGSDWSDDYRGIVEDPDIEDADLLKDIEAAAECNADEDEHPWDKDDKPLTKPIVLGPPKKAS